MYRVGADSLGLTTGGVGRVTVSNTQTYIIPTTASNSTTTGALRVGGGVGIGGNLNVGGGLVVTSENGITIGNDSTLFINSNNDSLVIENAVGDILLEPNGSVGVGTINPVSKLHVVGSITTRAAVTTSVATQIPVFTANPASTEQTIVTRTPAELRTDIGAAASSHTHGNLNNDGQVTNQGSIVSTDQLLVTSSTGVLKRAINAFGTSSTTFLANNGTFIAPNVQSRLASNVNTAATTTAALVFSFTLLPGIYDFESIGRVIKTGTTISRSYQVILSCDSTTGYSNIFAYAQFSPDTEVTFHTGSALSLSNNTIINGATASLLATTGSYFAGTNSTTQRAGNGMPYTVRGRIELTSVRTFRLHIRQSAGTTGSTVGILAGSYMRILRVG
jgi:hypothetical protein